MAKHNPYIHTQEYLVHALMQLTRSKPLSSISVTELTNRAGVSRMTYYRNYNSMSEILTRYLDGIFESYKRDVAGFGNPGKYNDYHIVLLCSQYFHTHKDFILCLLRCGMGDLLLSRLTKYVLDTYYCEEKGIAYYYTLLAFTGSFYNVYVAWIQNGTRESAEDIASLICSLFP